MGESCLRTFHYVAMHIILDVRRDREIGGRKKDEHLRMMIMPATFALDATSVDVHSTPQAPSKATSWWSALLARFGSTEPAESEIERYIQAHGGVLTDSLERDISRQFGQSSASNCRHPDLTESARLALALLACLERGARPSRGLSKV